MQGDPDKCTISTTLSVIGGKWKAVILWHLIGETRRFSEIKHLIPAVTQKMLTQQLRELEADGLLQRQVFAEVPSHVEYSLTAYGRTLIPVLQAMALWGAEHEQDWDSRTLSGNPELSENSDG